MLELLVTISLDPLKKSGQSHLLLPPEPSLLLLNQLVDGVFLTILLLLLLEVTLIVKLLCFLIPLRM